MSEIITKIPVSPAQAGEDRKPKIVQIKARVVSNKEIAEGYYKLLLGALKIAKTAVAGQFVTIRVSKDFQPLLRRPFSIHRIGHRLQVTGHRLGIKKACSLQLEACDLIEILYKVVGKGTEILSKKKKGEYLDILGPLGNGFDSRSIRGRQGSSILVAGGVGVAPLVFLAEILMKRDKRYLPASSQGAISDRLVLIGAKTKGEILCKKEFKDLGCKVKISTEDGSRGFKGKVTDLLKDILRVTSYAMPHRHSPRKIPKGSMRGGQGDIRYTIYACGPSPMLKEISLIGKRYRILTLGSLETHMACGIGACMGCVIKAKNPKPKTQNDFVYKLVCKDGPVFDLSTIKW